ncbi:MAG: hypothetical protein IPH44_23615 [Myxococcales bacterium]|nr:hypothetical protein [Myxococcales bacterium]MBK7195984.1 hypothetical protein [Myxococcales bacterium]
MRIKLTLALAMIGSVTWLTPAAAQDGPPPPTAAVAPADAVDDADPTAQDAIGVSVGVTVGSAYAFRGLNVYAADRQRDVAGQVAPWLTYAVPGTAITLTYWSSYQISGAMRGALIDAGVGAEQDLTVGWSRDLSPTLALAVAANAYVYPFADRAMAGVATPVYVEPAATITRSGAVDAAVQVAYQRGVQGAIAGYRYAYARVSVAREVAITSTRTVSTAAAYGVKFATPLTDNLHDAQVDVGVPFALPGGAASTLGLHGAWTDLAGVAAADELFVWASVDASVEL